MSVSLNVKQDRRRRQIVVPQIMMDILEIPLTHTCPNIDRYRRVAKEIVARAVATIKVRTRTAHWYVDKASLLIHGKSERPHVVANAVPPALTLPRLISKVTFLRYRVKFPAQCSGCSIKRTRIRICGRSTTPRVVKMRCDVCLSGPKHVGP